MLRDKCAARWLAFALVVAGTMATGTAHADTNARGVVSGAPHTVRIRPVLATVPAAPRHRPTASARAASVAALATCDPTKSASMSFAPDASARDDRANACVISASHRTAKATTRFLLGPADFTGNDVATVSIVNHRATGERGLELTFDDSHEQALEAFGAAHFHGQQVAVTLDGATVVFFALGGSESTFTGMHGALWFEPQHGFTREVARELRGNFDEARHEQLVGLLQSSTMTPTARKIVAAVTSSVDDKSQFAADCPLREVPDTLVLGCFGRGTLRVLRVDRPDLAPVMTVSMAHEMLHGAYRQLSRAERRTLDAELERVYRGIDDPQLTDLVAAYAISEPGKRDDELHSLLGTQVATLSPALERHYRRFFRDRQQVVTAFRSYDDVLSAIEHEHDDLEVQLTTMKSQLDDLDARIDEAGARSDDLAQQILDLRAQGRIAESNDLVESQNAAYHETEALLDQEHSVVDQYNALVDRYNELVQQSNEIYDLLSTRTADDPTP